MSEHVDIHKAAGLIVRDRKVLVSRSKGKDVFVQPGGKLELGETSEAAVVRELGEEQGARIDEGMLTFIGTYYAIAAGHEAEQLRLRLDAYLIDYGGPLAPAGEIEENRWIDSSAVGVIKMGSVMEHDIIPLFVEKNLID